MSKFNLERKNVRKKALGLNARELTKSFDKHSIVKFKPA